jgi:hypothetical protein
MGRRFQFNWPEGKQASSNDNSSNDVHKKKRDLHLKIIMMKMLHQHRRTGEVVSSSYRRSSVVQILQLQK